MARKTGGVNAHGKSPVSPAVSGLAHGDLVYNGGPLISCPQVHATFWGPDWSDEVHQAESQRLIQFLKDLSASSWMNILSQYGAGTGQNSATFTGSSFLPNVTGTLSDHDIPHRTPDRD